MPGASRFLRPIFLCMALACSLDLFAHRMPGSLTLIELNEGAGTIEVTHRLHRHDAELGLASASDDPHLTFDDVESRARLALYVEQRFRIAACRDDGVAADIDLTLIGAELQADFIFVYQEARQALPRCIAVRNDILRDVLPAQANQVNIVSGEGVRTLMFAGDDRWHTFDD
jgi:hypothetical protein